MFLLLICGKVFPDQTCPIQVFHKASIYTSFLILWGEMELQRFLVKNRSRRLQHLSNEESEDCVVLMHMLGIEFSYTQAPLPTQVAQQGSELFGQTL